MRRWDLAELCVADAAIMLSQGRRVCLRQLLKVHQAFAKDEQRYLFNTMYGEARFAMLELCVTMRLCLLTYSAINDLIVWIQKVPFEVLQVLLNAPLLLLVMGLYELHRHMQDKPLSLRLQ